MVEGDIKGLGTVQVPAAVIALEVIAQVDREPQSPANPVPCARLVPAPFCRSCFHDGLYSN